MSRTIFSLLISTLLLLAGWTTQSFAAISGHPTGRDDSDSTISAFTSALEGEVILAQRFRPRSTPTRRALAARRA